MRTLMMFFGLALLSFSCEKEEVTILPVAEVELELYAIVACGGDFDLENENAQEWGDRIVNSVTNEGLTILEYRVEFEEVEHPGFCGNCSPSGDILRVKTLTEDAEALRALGFQ